MNDAHRQAVWNGLQTYVQHENTFLAPYAMHAKDSKGRRHAEEEHLYRGPYQRDRDRVLHSAAYRRLADKTQVFTDEMGDYHRTRLTHTLEVSSIARTIGRALRLNEDLIEALALVHDIGHPPFGHAGEDILNECLKDCGGFSHNQYALCLVQELEVRYHEFSGLNLTHEVLEGQAGRIDKQRGPCPLFEAQVVDLADSITYDSHDTDDAVALGLLTLDDLLETALVREALRRVRERTGTVASEMLRKLVVHELIDWQVGDVLAHVGQWLQEHQPPSAQAVRATGFRLGPGQELSERKAELETFLYQHVYRHPKLVAERSRAQNQLREMFHGYEKQPELLPPKYLTRAGIVGLPRSIAEYLAGMTDRFCQQQYQRHFTCAIGG